MLEKRETRNTDLFVENYEQIYQELYNHAYQMIGNRDQASEAISDTILDAYTTFDNLEDIKDFRTWMSSILTIKCQNIIQQKSEDEIVLMPLEYTQALTQAIRFGSVKGVLSIRQNYQPNEDPANVIYGRFGYGSGVTLGYVAKVGIGFALAIAITFVSFAYVYMML